MSIRDQYIQAFEAIRHKHGEEDSSGWEIDPDVSLKQAIGYTGQYVVKHSQKHFRYDYYSCVLRMAMRDLSYNPGNGKILCMDIGCGPGLFSWVVQDYMSSHRVKRKNLMVIGYDHAKNMIRLSKKFHVSLRKQCATSYNWHGDFKFNRLKQNLKGLNFSNYDVIVTLGHVLIQINDNAQEMRKFSKIVRSLCPFKSCIVVAVDAYSLEERRRQFRSSWKVFRKALQDDKMNCKSEKFGPDRSYVYTRLKYGRVGS